MSHHGGRGKEAERPLQEEVRFSRPAHLAGIELVSARYRRRSFPKHVHEEFVVGAMTLGAERLEIGGSGHIAAAGDLILIAPGEAHSNQGLDNAAFAYSVMYISPLFVAEVLGAVGQRIGMRRFREPVARDRAMHRALLLTHRSLSGASEALEQQTCLLRFLCQLFVQEDLLSAARTSREPERIRLAREYIDAHFDRSISLASLSALTGISPFHLLRSFQREIGLSPSRYQNQLRINRGKQLLQQGHSIAEVAASLGYADQSHLTRQFQRIVGTTPKHYALAGLARTDSCGALA